MSAHSRQLEEQLNEAIAANLKLNEDKRGAYTERNRLVAFMASIFPSALTKTDIEGWHPEWHWCVYIFTRKGQLSWHIHESQLSMFDHVERRQVVWDGHTTDEKYQRLAELCFLARPRAFGPRVMSEQSWAHHIDYGGLNGGTYWLSWTHKFRNRNGESIMNQNRETDYKGALRFAKKWGLPAPPPPDVYPFGPSGRLLRTKEDDDAK